MISLTKLRNAGIAAVIALIITACFVAAVSAQKIEPQNQGSHYGDPGFKGEPINLNVVNADIRDILSYITDQYGINFVIDRSVKEVPVTVKVNDVPWNVALDSVLQSQELGVEVNGNILRIADTKTLAGEQEIKVKLNDNAIDNTPLYTELIRLNYATVGSGAGGASGTTSGTSVSGPSDGGGGGGGSVGGGGLLPIIKKRLSRRGAIETDPRSNSLIITDVATNLAAIKQLIAILDQPEPQVEIEARIVVATRSFSRDIGVQLAGILTGGHGSGGVGGTLPGATSTITPPVGTPIPSINNDLFSKIANTAIGLTTGRIGTFQLNALISAGEQKGQAKVIATPRITALNNSNAEIKSGTKIPITTVQPGSAAGGAVIATTTYVDVPLRLNIQPQITEQGTVILQMTAENSSVATIKGSATPAINSQSMVTKVVVPDGGTTVIGGVLFDNESESQDRTPGVSNIPLFGNLFKRKGVQRDTEEILFFVTPRIQIPDNATAKPTSGTRSTMILQPVPMGNPQSNSQPVTNTTGPVLQIPGLTAPAVPAATPNNKQP